VIFDTEYTYTIRITTGLVQQAGRWIGSLAAKL